MSLRKTVCLLAALLLGFGTQAFAQTAVPAGVRVRIASPDSAAWRGIGQTIRVNVLRTKTLAPTLDSVIVALRADTNAVSSATNLAAGSFANDTLGLDDRTNYVSALNSPNGTGTSVDTFKFTFTVAAGDPLANFVVAQALVSTSTSTAFDKLNNLNTTPISNVAGFTDPVGDRKFVRVDGQRPVADASVFDTLYIDTTTAAARNPSRFPGTTLSAFGIGEEAKLVLRTTNLAQTGASSARISIFEIGRTDSAIYTRNFDATTLVSAPGGQVRDSFVVQAGQFTVGRTGGGLDNLRTRLVGFLVDQAGNLSHPTSATATNPEGFSQDIVYVFDSKAPTVTLAHPDSSGDRFTGLVDTSIAWRMNDGTLATGSADDFSLKPLEFRVSEGTIQRWAIVGTDTAVYGGVNVTTATKVVSTDSFGASKGDQAGQSLTLNVVGVDSVGNKGNRSVASVIHDQEAPEVTQLFPNSAALPDDKINNVTRHPIFRINEAVDTISVRFVQTSGSPRDVVTQAVSSSRLSVVGEDITVTVQDSLLDDESYYFQIFLRDLAGNVNFTAEDTLTFDKQFQNPTADSFIVAVNEDSVLAGQAIRLTITAIDSQLTRQAGATRTAVTYNDANVLVSLVGADVDTSQITFWGTGVTNNAGNSATLNSEGWVTGARTVWFKSNRTINNFRIVVQDTSTTIVDGNPTTVVNFQGRTIPLAVDEADFRRFNVTAVEGGAPTSTVAGAFQLRVVPTDAYGNASLKAFKAGSSDLGTDSLKLLDTRIPKANRLSQIFATFATNLAGAQVPSGPQVVTADTSLFTAIAPPGEGSGLVISAIATTVGTGDSGSLPQFQATGSVTLSWVADDGGIPTPVDSIAAPRNLVVQDYLGAGGNGDQGFYVMVSFPKSTNTNVSQYRLYRELSVNTVLDSAGNVVTTNDPVLRWVPWTAIDAVPDTAERVVRAVVPVVDNLATRWAVAAEVGRSSSEQVVAGKRVFSKESVQQMAQFLGVDPNRIVSPESLGEMFMPSAEYVKSILGDRKNVVFAALDPDVSSLFGNNAVPQSIRTQSSQIASSARTLAPEPVAAVDNIAPAQVAEGSVSGNTVTWTASSSDHVVGYVNYRGFAIPMAGVTQYEIMGGSSEENLAVIGTVPGGTTSFTGENLPSVIRVDALDLDNRTAGQIITGPGGNIPVVVGPNGQRLGITLPIDRAQTPYTVDFEDFIAFATAFNATIGSPNFNPAAAALADPTDVVNFADFIAFAQTFGLTGTTANGQPIPSSKPVTAPAMPGVNENAEFSLSLGADGVLVGKTVSVDVSLAQVEALMGYGFVLNYETDKFEFVEAVPADQDLMKSTGGETPLFLTKAEAGQVTVANAVVNGSAVSGNGDIVRLTFKVLREFDADARFEIAQGIVFDPKELSNQAVVAGVLDVQSTPTEFALLQNFPNPFNPETTIKYELSESADVTLQIYNVVGQVVRTLVAERQSVGRYQVRWNGMDERGAPVSSGIYFYQISAGKFQDVRKLMLLK